MNGESPFSSRTTSTYICMRNSACSATCRMQIFSFTIIVFSNVPWQFLQTVFFTKTVFFHQILWTFRCCCCCSCRPAFFHQLYSARPVFATKYSERKIYVWWNEPTVANLPQNSGNQLEVDLTQLTRIIVTSLVTTVSLIAYISEVILQWDLTNVKYFLIPKWVTVNSPTPIFIGYHCSQETIDWLLQATSFKAKRTVSGVALLILWAWPKL